MFPRLNRFPLRAYLKDHPDFFATAQKLRGSFFMIFYQTEKNGAEDGNQSQAACIVSQKNFPKAVDRNKTKRQVRALISPLLNQVPQNERQERIQLVMVIYRPIETKEQKGALCSKVKIINNL
jgi:ribonuclease P protein component